METLLHFAFWAGLILFAMQLGRGILVTGRGHGPDDACGQGPPQPSNDIRWVAPETDVDPVCGKRVHTRSAKPSVHDGWVYYFCSRECRERFEAAPHLYVGPTSSRQPKLADHAHG